MTIQTVDQWLSRRARAALMAGLLAGSFLTPVSLSAQTIPAEEDEAAAPQVEADGTETDDYAGEEIVVTGSLIARPDYSSTSPIISVGEERLKETGGLTVDSALNQLPQFVPNRNSSTNFPGFGRPNIQLRGLGPGRTLVLVNGRRYIGDINSIPSAFVDRIEVITGGASTAYGSDAVAGVVNVITGRQPDGLVTDVQLGLTERGDGESVNASLAYKTDFGGRGKFMIGGSYQHRETTWKRDREFSRVSLQELDVTIPEGRFEHLGNLPSQAAINTIFARYGAAPGTVSRATPIGVNDDGTLFTTNNPLINYRGQLDERYAFNPNGVLTYNGSLFTPLDTPLDSVGVFAQADMDLADWAEVYSEVSFNRYEASWGQGPGNAGAFLWNLSIPVNNPFIPNDLRQLLASRSNPNANFAYIKRLEAQPPRRVDITTQILQVVAGLRGSIPNSSLQWDIYGSYGKFDNKEVNQSGNLDAIQTLLQAPDGGKSICAGGYNPFGEQPISAECVQYTSAREPRFEDRDLRMAEAILRGDLFRLFASEPIRFAVGTQYREEGQVNVPGQLAIRNRLPNFAGQFALNGEISVKEAFTELLIPLVEDLPLVEKLSIGAGYRYSDYNLTGGVEAYKLDAEWMIGGGLRLRGGYNRAVKAPTIVDLFSPLRNTAPNIGTPGSGLGGDPCDIRGSYRKGANAAQVRALCVQQGIPEGAIDTYTNGLAIVVGRAGGNPNLGPELSDTYTVGGVWRSPLASPLMSDLQLSVDYYEINLRDAIGSIGANETLSRCFLAEFNPTFSNDNIYCRLIKRGAGGQFDYIDAALQNIGGFQISGVDFQLDWRVPVGPGRLFVNSAWSYLMNFKRQNLPGEAFIDFAGTIGPRDTTRNEDARPKWKGVSTIGYEVGPFSANVRWRFIDAMKDQVLLLNPNANAIGPGEYHLFDLNMRYSVSDEVSVRGGVINLGDRQPPFFSSANQANTDPATYDVLGRRFYFGFSFGF